MSYLSSLPSSHFCSLSLCIHTLAHHVVPLVSALITLLFSLSMYTYFSSSCCTSRLCPHHTSVLSLSMYTYFSLSCCTSRLCPHHTSVLSLSLCIHTLARHVVPHVSALITLLFSLSPCIHTLGVMLYLSSLPSSHFCSLSMYTYFRCHVVPLVSALITLLLPLYVYIF